MSIILVRAGALLRRTGLSPELRLPVILVLLRANASRSWQIGGSLFYGERGLIGADVRLVFDSLDLFAQFFMLTVNSIIDTVCISNSSIYDDLTNS